MEFFSGLTLNPSLSLFRRYIANLDPYYILALAETASDHQVEALRDAIFKHIALQTSIRVRIPVSSPSPGILVC
jgi:hypothetical protein